MDHTAELTHISLCAGYGGIDLGLKRALRSVRTVAFSEIEAYAVANLVTKIENGHLDAAPIWTNLKTFPWGAFRGRVDILSGGFPCQPFSQAGRRAGDDDPRHLWPYIERGIRELGRPPLIFLENVEGILSASLSGTGWSDPAGTPVLQHILRELERMDYRATAGVFSAAEVGAPHQRKRVFILAVRSDLSADGHGRVSRLLEDSNSSRERQGEQGRPNGQERRAVDGGGESLFQRTASADHARSTGVRGRETMGHAENRGRERGMGRGQSTEQGVPVQVREPSTGADLAHTHNAGDAALRDNANRNGEARGCGRGCDEPQLEPMRRGEARGICGDDRRPLNAGEVEAQVIEQLDEVADAKHRGDNAGEQQPARYRTVEDMQRPFIEDRGDLWPAGRGARQYAWEPPRVTPKEQEYIKPAMGGGVNGCAGGVGNGDLRRAVDSRTDELRLLGNGVVPATAERAFRVLWGELDTHPRA